MQEDWGWKLIHGEVFRTPRYPMLLAMLVGNGSQLTVMFGVTLGELNIEFKSIMIYMFAMQFSLCWVSCRHLIEALLPQ